MRVVVAAMLTYTATTPLPSAASSSRHPPLELTPVPVVFDVRLSVEVPLPVKRAVPSPFTENVLLGVVVPIPTRVLVASILNKGISALVVATANELALVGIVEVLLLL